MCRRPARRPRNLRSARTGTDLAAIVGVRPTGRSRTNLNRYTVTNMLVFTILTLWLGSGCAGPGMDNNEARTVGVTVVHRDSLVVQRRDR